MGRLTRWTRHAVWPAQLADGLIALHIINETLDMDLHHWAPVRGWALSCHQYRTSSHSTTLKSNKSVGMMQRGGQVVINLLAHVKQKTIEPLIKDTIMPGTLVYTDEYSI